MNPGRWDELDAAFEELSGLSPPEREARLAALRSTDQELAQWLEALLAADAGSDAEPTSLPGTGDPFGLSGRTISHFRIGEVVGAGGMGVVYRAEDLSLGRRVALKFLLPQYGLDATAKRRFLQEARSAAALDHPNLCTVHEAGESEEGRLFLAMPLYEGETLRERLDREGALPVEEAVEIARQVARGLARAHAAGIVHRDLKPGNLMLLPDGTVKILDFGLAKVRDLSLSGRGARLGTVAYMAPEQVRGQAVDERADLWALGVVLYEMLTGRRPFGGEGGMSTAYSILHEIPPPLSSLLSGAPGAVAETVARLLEKDPVKRSASAAALLPDLTSPTSPATFPLKAQAGGRAGLTAALGAAALLAVWGAGAVLRSTGVGGEEGQQSLAIFPFCLQGEDGLDGWGEDVALLLGRSLDGLGDLRSIDENSLLSAAAREAVGCRDPEAARALASRFGAELFVLGNLVEAGGRLRGDAWLYGADGRVLSSVAYTVASEAEALDLVDGLARELAARRFGTGPEELVGIAAQTTASIEAVKAFGEGERGLRSDSLRVAIAAFQRAVAIDTAFALAWLRLSWTFDARGEQSPETREAAERATRHAQRLPERERSFLTAWTAYLRGAPGEALEHYRVHLGRWPGDVNAWGEFADVEIHYGPLLGRSRLGSREGLERVLAVKPDHGPTLSHLFWLLRSTGLDSEADSLQERRRTISPRNEQMAVEVAFRLGGSREQQEVVSRIVRPSTDLGVFLMPQHAIGARNFEGAETLLRVGTEPSRSARVRSVAHLRLADLALLRGRRRAAQAELDSAARLDPLAALEHRALRSALPFVEVERRELERLREELRAWSAQVPRDTAANQWFAPHEEMHRHIRLYLLGLLSARLGDERLAGAYADTLGTLSSPPEAPALAENLATGVRAYEAWVRGDLAGTLRAVERIRVEMMFPLMHSSDFVGHALERFLRAEALRALGRREEAQGWYQGLQDPYFWPHLPYIGLAHLRLAELHERRGEREKAAELYGRFLETWGACDPELRPLLEEAGRGLERTRS